MGGTRTLELPRRCVALAQVFSAMVALQARRAVTDWGVSTATLEQAFLAIVRAASGDDSGALA